VASAFAGSVDASVGGAPHPIARAPIASIEIVPIAGRSLRLMIIAMVLSTMGPLPQASGSGSTVSSVLTGVAWRLVEESSATRHVSTPATAIDLSSNQVSPVARMDN